MMRIKYYYIYLSLILYATFAFGSVQPRTSVWRDLPEQNDTFEHIRAKGSVYVDKTSFITKLLQHEDRFFSLCRPGRFGKTNFLHMLRSFFAGRQESFAGLAINAEHDWRTSYPVIYLDFGSMDCASRKIFKRDLRQAVQNVGRTFDIELHDDSIAENNPEYEEFLDSPEKLLFDLIRQLAGNGTRNESVVLLIDEYDWPVRPRYDRGYGQYHVTVDFVRIKEFQYYLNEIFRDLQSVQHFIKLLFCTCTASMHYMNRGFPLNLTDLTYSAQFDTMIGLTEDELISDLAPHVRAMVGNTPNETFQSVVQQLRRCCNGYCFRPKKADTAPRLYNFHSILTCLRNKSVDHLWRPDVDPKYAVIDDYSIHEIERHADSVALGNILSTDSFTISRDTLLRSCACFEKLPLEVLLVIRGYLTFRDYDPETQDYTVAFPNEGMRESYQRAVLKIISGGQDLPSGEFTRSCQVLTRCMTVGAGAKLFVAFLNLLLFGNYDANRALDWHRGHTTDRVATLMRACDFSLRENSSLVSLRENAPPHEIETLKVAFREKEYKEGHFLVEGEQRFAGLDVVSMNCSEHWFHFEYARSAPCAVNALLRMVSSKVDWPEGQTLYLMGINFPARDSEIKEWIRIRCARGKFIDMESSNPNYSKMYAHILGGNTSSSIV